jgi:transketolase
VAYSAKPKAALKNIAKGAYVLREAKGGKPAMVLIATGSELPLAMEAAQVLEAEHGIATRVVSMPSTNVFDRQTVAYKSSILPAGTARVAIEMGSTDGWWKYGCAAVVGIDTYGESAPAPVLFEHFGFTVANVVSTARAALQQ